MKFSLGSRVRVVRKEGYCLTYPDCEGKIGVITACYVEDEYDSGSYLVFGHLFFESELEEA